MKRMIFATLAVAAIAAQSSAAELRFSVGIRETNSPGPIGTNGGSAGGIEWVGRPNDGADIDVNLVPADGSWHLVNFDFNNDPVRGFTGNHILESTTGFSVFEHLRIANTADGVTRYKVYIDDIVNTVNGTPTTVTDFEGYAVGSEALFQEPRFSGSTSAVVQLAPNVARVTDSLAFGGSQSYEVEFDFVNDTPAGIGGGGNWLRLTTAASGTTPLPNVVIGVPNSSAPNPGTASLSMRIMVVAVPEPASFLLLGTVAAVGMVLGRRRV